MSSERNNRSSNPDNVGASDKRKREVYHYESDWLISTLAWSEDSGSAFELAFGSFIEEYSNYITIVRLAADDTDQEFQEVTSFVHPYPPTKILWKPRNESRTGPSGLFATSADFLRIWRYDLNNNEPVLAGERSSFVGRTELNGTKPNVKLESRLSIKEGEKNCAPLTSFDWNRSDIRMIISSSVDTTCAIWDLETSQNVISACLRSQVLAHNNEVYDVSFLHDSRDLFVSSGGDGSVRLFDLRKLDTSTILYEANNVVGANRALVRVSCNKQEPYYITTFGVDSNKIILLDLRRADNPVAILASNSSIVNCMSWAPHSTHHICSATEDGQALIWQLSDQPERSVKEPLLTYKATDPINAIGWSASNSDWIAIGCKNRLEMLRV